MKPFRQRSFRLPHFLALGLCALTCSPTLLADLNTGLVAWYPFDGNASDMSGNGNHGTVNGAILGEDRHGVAGKAYQFDGVDDFLDMGDKAEFDGRVAQTISLWLSVSTKGSGTGNNIRPVLSKWYSSGSVSRNSFHISADENGIHHSVSSDSISSSIDATSDYELNEWHHALLKFNGGNLLLYLNGALISNETVNANSLSNATEPLLVGNWYQGYDPAYKTFHGSIDEVRIYDRALSAAEVAELYAMESALPAGSVTLDKLAPELRDLLDGNGTIEQALPAGSVIAVKPDDPAPVGYTLFQRNEYNASLSWEEKAPVSVARFVSDGATTLGDKIYLMGGGKTQAYNIAERYDPVTNQWETLNPMSVGRSWVTSADLNGKIYAIGGGGLSSVEIYDPATGQWSDGPVLPSNLKRAASITFGGKILLVGGESSGQAISQVLELDPMINQWIQKAPMPTARHDLKLVLLNDKVWAIGGAAGANYLTKVEIYDPATNTWTTGPSLATKRKNPSIWVASGRIYAAGGAKAHSSALDSIEIYDPATNQWTAAGSLPEEKYAGDATIIGNKVYVVAGNDSGSGYSDKVFAADLPPPAMNLYFKDGNATAEAATEPDGMAAGSVTLNMLAPDALAKLGVNQTHAQSAGSVLAVPKDNAPPAGYSLYKRSDRNSSLAWEEKAPVSVARAVFKGSAYLDEKIYLFGGTNSSDTNLDNLDSYDPLTNNWSLLEPMSVARKGLASSVLEGKIYAIGGQGLSSVEAYDPSTNTWSSRQALPSEVNHGAAVSFQGKIYLFGGRNSNDQQIDQVLEYTPSTNQWLAKAPMPTARHGSVVLVHEEKIWVIGGFVSSDTVSGVVEVYDPSTNSWSGKAAFPQQMAWAAHWVQNGKIVVAGGKTYSASLDQIYKYNSLDNSWGQAGSLPFQISYAGSVQNENTVYLISGSDGTSQTNKVYAADITPPMDLYFRDANATGTVTLDKLDGAVISKLDGNASALPPIGAVSAIDHHDSPPADQAVLERTDRNATHVWEEMAPVSVSRHASDGVEALDGKIYFVGGYTSSASDRVERYDPATNQWETIAPLQVAREGLAATVLDGKIYAIAGENLSSVEIYDPETNQWSFGIPLPSAVDRGTAITVHGKILFVGGRNASSQNINQVFEFDPSTNQWTQKASMATARHAVKLVWYGNRVWAISGSGGGVAVESYDPVANSWQNETSLTVSRSWACAWVGHDRIYIAGGSSLSSIESYDRESKQWSAAGNLPENKYAADATVLGDKVYVVSGSPSAGNFSDKVYAADLIPHRDLYFREANVTAPTHPAPNQPPVFSGGTATFTTAENNASASFFVTATDPDANTTLVYSASGPDAGKFTLNAITGELTFNTPPDFDANASASGNNVYQVTITVSDGTASATQNVTINVTDDPADNPIDLTQGLVAWYPFDGNASDMSGNNHHGTVNGATLGVDRHGRVGKAYVFDGVDDNIIAPAGIHLPTGANPRTLSTWVLAHSYVKGSGSGYFDKEIFGWGSDQNNQKSVLALKYYGAFFFWGWFEDINTQATSTDTWYNLVFTYDGATGSLYLDGQLSGSNALSLNTANTLLHIGRGTGGNDFLDGSLDDIRIYDRALSASEVQSLYQLESTPPTENNQTDPNPPADNTTIPPVDNNGTNPPVDNNATNPPVDENQTDPDQNATAPAPDPAPPPTLFRPLPKTLASEELGNSNFRLWGQVLADGGSPITSVAFELADNMVFRNSTLHPASMLARSPSFFVEFTLEPGKRYYYRAVATNAIGTTSGSPKRLITPPSQAHWWTNAPEISGGWRNSPWLGAFRPYDNGWIYHAKLGWAYAHPDGSGGLWLWIRDHHWMWTRPGVFPYLWKHDLGTWLYLLGVRDGNPVFFDFVTNSVR